MLWVENRPVCSATDLVGFLECGHLTSLERASVSGHIQRPARADPVLDRISQRGREHEERFLASLRDEGLELPEIGSDEALPYSEHLTQGHVSTLAAMRDGADAIYQAVLFDGHRLGHADFLRRVEQPSDLGGWSYEVWDTKLARHPKGVGRSAAVHVLGHGGCAAGKGTDRDAPALGGVQRETVSFPRGRIRRLLPARGARVRGAVERCSGLPGCHEARASRALRCVPVERRVPIPMA